MLNDNQKLGLRVVSVLVAALWVVLGLVGGWPLWVWLLLAASSLAAPALFGVVLTESVLRRGTRTRVPPEDFRTEPPPAPRPPEPPQPQSFPVTDVVLSSARADYRFLFSCTVRWLPCGSASGLPHTKPGALAAGAILDEVTRMAAEVRPEDASRAQYQLMGSLGAPRVDRTGRVQAWADQVVLRLADADADRLKRLAEVRKDEEVWEYERSYERNVRSYLGGEVLTSTGNALVWWLAGPRTDEKKRVDEAVGRIADLRQLTRTANGEDDGPEPVGFAGFDHEGFAFAAAEMAGPPSPMPAMISAPVAQNGNGATAQEDRERPRDARALDFLSELPDSPERALLARQVADHLREQGFADEAATISRRFDSPAGEGDSGEPHEPGGTGELGGAPPLPDEVVAEAEEDVVVDDEHDETSRGAATGTDGSDRAAAEPGH
ncbi:hypothetical protein LCD36_00775 [Saccharopolyspora sp. 6T]|uniref:hypothetical protein n=1 Tax=Saccharopolyspora sp. 6T TaxID=2877238 RepID=UPI001CD3FDB8|nr:hypothetical protein [Saccharopolyspora sp. 6T]MCA1184978.1 hypothetical protein [Saccharopolyspora sp. 6T]